MIKSAYVPATLPDTSLRNGTDPRVAMHELYNAGMSVFDICLNLGFTRDEIRDELGIKTFKENYSPYPPNFAKQMEIINEYTDFGVVAQSLIVSQKKRASDYANLESKALRAANKLLDYYQKIDCGDNATDRLTLDIIDKVLGKTQNARATLIKEYTDLNTQFIKTNSTDKDVVQVEIVSVDEN